MKFHLLAFAFVAGIAAQAQPVGYTCRYPVKNVRSEIAPALMCKKQGGEAPKSHLTADAAPQLMQAGAHVPNQLLVQLNYNSDMNYVAQQLNAMGFTLKSYNNISPSFKIWELSFAPYINEADALEKTKQVPGVAKAQYNHYLQERVTIPNDAQFSTMWGMDNTGQSGGTVDADIDATDAWDITTGGVTSTGDTIVVAVIDGGFFLAHQDLNFWKNYDEIPNNNIDDDNNGYVDDFNGWNAFNNTGNITSSNHGTHVSGTVGARGNNTIGVVGVNWGGKVMAVQGSSGTESTVVTAYTYVFDNRKLYNQSGGQQGAFVVATNSSFGVDLGNPSNYPIWCAMYDSLGAVGILSAAATANQNYNIDTQGDIPTACASNYMIAVTNTTRFDVKTTSAGYGLTTIDLGSPGSSIISTYPNNAYQSISGTSMATPHVAGTVGLMYAAACPELIYYYKNHPGLIALQMKDYLLDSVDVLTALQGLTVTGGRLNAYKALQAVQTYNCSALTVQQVPVESVTLQIEGIYPNPAGERTEVVYVAPGLTEVTLSIHNLLGQEVMRIRKSANGGMNKQQLDLSGLGNGIYTVRVEAGSVFSNAVRVVVAR
jgi:serine protease